MKTRFLTNKILVLLLTLFSIFFFAGIFIAIPKTSADIQGVSGNKFVLTSSIGNTQGHYFRDSSNTSTLSYAEVSDEGGDYYSIVPSSGMLLGKNSSGYAIVRTTNDINSLIEKGVVYARISFSFQSKNNNSQSNIQVTFSQGGNQKIITTSYNNSQKTEYISSLIKLDSSSNELKFAWTTLASTSVGNYSDFILSEPTIRLYTQIEKIEFSNEDQYVSAGASIKLNATNDVLSVNNVSGNFLNYSKVNHAIVYEFVSGEEWASVVGNYLYIDSSAPDKAIIQLKATCRENSYDDTFLQSDNILTLTVSDSQIQVKVRTDFDNPPQIKGQGLYKEGTRVFLSYSQDDDFIFEGWFVNDEKISTSTILNYVVKAGDDIYAKFVKKISVLSVGVNNKVYDGTTEINQEDIIFNFDGVEEKHEVYLTGSNFYFATASAGQNKAIVVENAGAIELAGADAQFYQLQTKLIPQSYAEILKRDLTIIPTSISKEYGEKDGELTYTALGLVDGDSLQGNLTRERGEEVGVYKIGLGSLQNSNYNIKLAEGEFDFEITQRQLVFSSLYAEDKTYDKTMSADLVVEISNVLDGENVNVDIVASYKDANAGYGKEIVINSCTLVGKDKDNYTISLPSAPLYGNILQKSVTVEANAQTFTYGDEINLSYNAQLLDGDSFTGSLTIDDINVGTHSILLGSLSNPNYLISFTSATCTITARDITVTAEALQKEYGDGDPILTYEVENLVKGDNLSGSLARQSGEEIGRYEITQGSLSNSNYNITFVPNYLEIVKRAITIELSFKDKVYNGQLNVENEVNFANTLSADQFSLQVQAILESKDAGKSKVNIIESSVEGQNLEKYNFEIIVLNEYIQISKMPVTVYVDSLSKIYGEDDPEITFSYKIVEGEELVGAPKRNSGENVGQYSYYLDDLNSENNPNYDIVIDSSSVFTVLPKTINVKIDNLSKTYGDNDPEFSISLLDSSQLQFNDSLQDIISGEIFRDEGENVGIYLLNTSNLQISQNYSIIFESLNFVINKRPITIIADDATKIYGDEDPQFTYQTINTVENQPVGITIKRQYGENVGEYELVLESANDARYSITFVPGVLNITPSKITVKAESKIKIYGDEDPYFDAIIVDGLLKNNDVLSNIIQGQMVRESGEDVGVYQINQGSYSLGDNYTVSFQSNILEIVAQDIEVTANLTTKQYGDTDPVIGYKVTSGQLKFSDDFVGALTRDSGETLGSYKIYQGTLALSDNYNLSFVSNEFIIEKRVIEIIPKNTSKYYGESEPDVNYLIIGSLVNDDQLIGEIYRDKPTTESDPYLYENVGSYKIYSTLHHDNYQIIFDTYYFEVMPRVIEIQANNASKTYGENDPELTYQIVSGEILDGDKISGSISRVAGENAGNYDIRSNLNLGMNYTIIFTKGIFTINPIEIVVKTENYSKIYGQMDPAFTYTIVEGKLINGDILYGNITRQQGEDVGVYKMLSNLSNINYSVSVLEAYLVIEKKDVLMLASVYDKIYDGTNSAVIKTPVLSGLVDKDVSLQYDKYNCAKFATSEVGDNIPVTFYDIKLIGDKAGNYNLILPTDVTGSITYDQLSAEEVVVVEAIDNACLYNGTTLNFNNFEIAREDMGLNKYQVVSGFSIWLENGGKLVDLNSTISLTITLTGDFASRNNIYVYHKNSNGEYVLVNSENENGQITIKIDELGEFVIMTDNDAWIDVVSYVCIGVLGLFFICYIIYLVRNRKKTKKVD